MITVTVMTETFVCYTGMTLEINEKMKNRNRASRFGDTPMSLQSAAMKVTVLVKPLRGKSFTRTVPTAELSMLFDGAWPNSESWAVIVEKLKNRY